MTKRLAFLLTCASICFAQQNAVNPSGSIAAVLVGDDGTLIAGAYVTLHPIGSFSFSKMRILNLSTTSGSDGSFLFLDLQPGSYAVCAQAPRTVWLNPCEWGLQPPTLAATATPGLTVTLKKGAVIPIRVDDPAQLLSANEGQTPGAHLLLGVGDDSRIFREAAVVSTDATGRNYQIVIPFATSVTLVVNGGYFQLSNAVGQALAQTGSTFIPVTVPVGQQASTIRFVVTGTSK